MRGAPRPSLGPKGPRTGGIGLKDATAPGNPAEIRPERLPDSLTAGRSAGASAGGSIEPRLAELPEEGICFHDHIEEVEKQLLRAALERGGGVQTRAAKLLNMSLRSFRYLIQKYNLR